MATILVVDDEADLEVLIKQKFRKKIRQKEYEFLFAENGVVALQKITDHPEVDIVLSDINMPEMDGLTLLSKLHDSSPLIKSVIVIRYFRRFLLQQKRKLVQVVIFLFTIMLRYK